MSRRMLALACALALLAPIAPVWGAEASPPYAHTWQAEGVFSGERGETRRVRGPGSMSMRLENGRFVGKVTYADTLGMRDVSGSLTGQRASIEITLTGTSAEGGKSAAGTFAGQAVLVTQPLSSLDDLARLSASSAGDRVVYEVSGHWGARLRGGFAEGELLYERATPVSRSVPNAEVRDVLWFDRLSAEKGGGAQTFRVEVQGLAAESVQTTGPQAGGIGFLGYVSRGVSGNPGVPAAPLPLSLTQRARALKDAAPPAATALPANAVGIDVDVPGTYLDAKNRAAGLLDDSGPAGTAGRQLTRAWAPARIARPRLNEPETVRLILSHLQGQRVPGASELASDLARMQPTTADAPLLSAWNAVTDAVARGGKPVVLSATAEEVGAVGSAPVPRSGPLAASVLAALQSKAAPRSAVDVRSMKREPSRDSSGSPSGGDFPGEVIAAAGGTAGGGTGTLSFPTATGRTTVAPPVWPAYRRADETLFWLAGPDGSVALTDGTLLGAGFVVPRAYLVEATDVGRILAVYDLR